MTAENCASRSISPPWMARIRGVLLLVVLDLVAVGQRLALRVPVVGVLRVGHAHVRRVLLQLPRPRAHEVLRPRRGVEALGQDDQVVVVRGRVEREVAVRRVELEHHRRVVGGLRAALRQHAGERRERVGAGVGVGMQVERRRDVLRRHRLAVVELHALTDLERPLRAVAVGLPALGEPRHRRQLAVGEDQVLARLPERAEGALVVDLDRVEVRAGQLEPRPDGAALLDGGLVGLCARALARSALVSAPACAREEAHHRQRHPDDGAAPNELAATDVPGAVLVDDVVLELAALGANGVDLSLNLILAQSACSPRHPRNRLLALSHGRAGVSTQVTLSP